MIKMYIGLHVKCPLLLLCFYETWILWTDFRKILKYQISWISIRWEPSCCTWVGGLTDGHEEAASRISEFCESAYN